ncbi:metal-binding protein [Umezakia ovalisporum]|uniref:Metal-binding protein n=2 Tax=Umezakia ovalisporum TaxID=75695 RepID=A0AA43KFE2_9CYAN|nr:metal-binding protein [Umezakia ovalisporum]MDH6055643.1 metal-binding protein [Umezakia ovalisporum FSS-43]MDH6064646.1 metal-binding protein [Umezakia ovalisporum FSS-62]MDH6069646.1 metal-binding protein [Umezakia ovalisporum CobakiLakeA]MDH6076662.1 metal-binding protein [Umezakia ovalisporum FSS-45]MDH6080264.1 metal-binding protein [Umezakia ovalisporum FSS-44]
MPSAETHDRITLYTLPLVAGVTLWQTSSSNLTLLVASGFMFSGLMFGPDLDIYSRQFQRWGIFRFLWLPYQKSLRHRSVLSHGPIIGTTLRVVYLGCFLGVMATVIMVMGAKLGIFTLTWQDLGVTVRRWLVVYTTEYLALFLGLELGAMSHSLSDWGGSAYKRLQKQGVGSLLPGGKVRKGRRKRSL